MYARHKRALLSAHTHGQGTARARAHGVRAGCTLYTRAFVSNAVVVGRGGVAEVGDVHVEEDHAAELVHGERC